LRLWDPRDGTQLATLLGHNGDMTDLAVAATGDLIASCGIDGTVRLWRATKDSAAN
jgi:WD40 repeat protein